MSRHLHTAAAVLFSLSVQANMSGYAADKAIEVIELLILPAIQIKGVAASGSREIGHYYRRGTYIIEIIQGNKRVQIKVLKS